MTTSTNKEVGGKPTEESAMDGATLLNHNRRNHKDESDRDEMDSGRLKLCTSVIIAKIKFCYHTDEEEDDEDQTPLYFFLAGIGLDEQFIEPFIKEKFDLDSLMLINDQDLISMKIPRGHRLKLLKAINDRKAAIENSPYEMEDSYL